MPLNPTAAVPNRLRNTVAHLFETCGIDIDGPAATDIQVLNRGFYSRVLANGSLGLGEAYMDGWWEARDLDGFFHRLLSAGVGRGLWSWRNLVAWLTAALTNLQAAGRAFEVGERHYDLGNEFYQRMLDRRMIYSCAYWENASTLDEAQEAKLDLVFGKLGLRPGQRVLDVGCGWGGALRHAAERYGVTGFGLTISREQAEYARRSCVGLPVTIHLQDYRQHGQGQHGQRQHTGALNGPFDHIYSIGMFEHVGKRNYRTYMSIMRRWLRGDGRFLLHTIGGLRSTNHTDPWIDKYIFPNSMLPSQRQIASAIQGLFMIDGWQRIGAHYDRTLLAWRSNCVRHWAQSGAPGDERFRRMWYYYLSACAGAFRARKLDVWQVLLAPTPGAPRPGPRRVVR